jgi:hypothetical protein
MGTAYDTIRTRSWCGNMGALSRPMLAVHSCCHEVGLCVRRKEYQAHQEYLNIYIPHKPWKRQNDSLKSEQKLLPIRKEDLLLYVTHST